MAMMVFFLFLFLGQFCLHSLLIPHDDYGSDEYDDGDDDDDDVGAP